MLKNKPAMLWEKNLEVTEFISNLQVSDSAKGAVLHFIYCHRVDLELIVFLEHVIAIKKPKFEIQLDMEKGFHFLKASNN